MSLTGRYGRWMTALCAAASLLLVGFVAKARAADCMSLSGCTEQAMDQRADAETRQNEAALYRIAAFKSAAQGDTAAANMYLAAANQKSNEAGLLLIAATNSDNRGKFFAALDPDNQPDSSASAARSHFVTHTAKCGPYRMWRLCNVTIPNPATHGLRLYHVMGKNRSGALMACLISGAYDPNYGAVDYGHGECSAYASGRKLAIARVRDQASTPSQGETLQIWGWWH